MITLNWNIIWVVVNMIILLILLRIFLYKPLQNMIRKRTDLIQGEINAAEQKNRDATSLKLQYEDSLRSADDKSAQIIETAKNSAQEQSRAILEKANQEAAQIIRKAGRDAEAERETILRETRGELTELVLAAVEKIFGDTVDDSVNRKILDDFLAEEGSMNG